jgi:hypothetical protein
MPEAHGLKKKRMNDVMLMVFKCGRKKSKKCEKEQLDELSKKNNIK